MGTPVTGQIGPTQLSDGIAGDPAVMRLDNQRAQVVTDAHGRYHESACRQKLFTAHNVAAQAVSVALATTYTGLCLSNPIGNTFKASLIGAGYALSVAPAGIASLHLITGFSGTTDVVHTTPLASPGIQSNFLNGKTTSSMKVDSAATIVNPGYLWPLVGGFTAAALPSSPLSWFDLAGLFVVPPGGWIALGALTAVTGFAAFAWEELPL